MKILIATIASLAWFAIAASAQECLITTPNLSYQQWYQYCASQINQMCSAPPLQDTPNCAAMIGQAEYQTYVASQHVMPPCGPQMAGQQTCINGYVATCNGTQWMTSAQHC